VNTNGFEAIASKSIIDNLFDLYCNYSFNSTINKTKLFVDDNSYNKYLMYSPKHRFNYCITFMYNNFIFSLNGNYTGTRYYSSDNSPQSLLEAYHINDLSVTYKVSVLLTKMNITGSIYNLFNRSYMIIQSYPMPLRNYYLTFNIEV